ncbi:hypothetical protein GCM10011572_21760 [Pseudoduganella buxea]|uniref:Uncharacterized protein n=1 Tax=Pseudoduganella buxea TaxID=1949069 RepID=A0ABQ1KIH1_9BURK|nr:hypothetical protein GCM10011572_21760 [Pseudoduganella buxea]
MPTHGPAADPQRTPWATERSSCRAPRADRRGGGIGFFRLAAQPIAALARAWLELFEWMHVDGFLSQSVARVEILSMNGSLLSQFRAAISLFFDSTVRNYWSLRRA